MFKPGTGFWSRGIEKRQHWGSVDKWARFSCCHLGSAFFLLIVTSKRRGEGPPFHRFCLTAHSVWIYALVSRDLGSLGGGGEKYSTYPRLGLEVNWTFVGSSFAHSLLICHRPFSAHSCFELEPPHPFPSRTCGSSYLLDIFPWHEVIGPKTWNEMKSTLKFSLFGGMNVMKHCLERREWTPFLDDENKWFRNMRLQENMQICYDIDMYIKCTRL